MDPTPVLNLSPVVQVKVDDLCTFNYSISQLVMNKYKGFTRADLPLLPTLERFKCANSTELTCLNCSLLKFYSWSRAGLVVKGGDS